MKHYLLLAIAVCLLSCGAADRTKVSDQAGIQGVWLAQSESQNGIKKDVSFVYVFERDTLTFTDETGKETKYLFRLDTGVSPRLLIIRPADEPQPSAGVSVAYALNGDSLTIVVAPPGLTPKDLSDHNDQELIVCKRRKSVSP